jgi:hypothetical protein
MTGVRSSGFRPRFVGPVAGRFGPIDTDATDADTTTGTQSRRALGTGVSVRLESHGE